MKKFLIPVTLVFFVGMVASSSCKKDKDEPAPTAEQLLTRSGGWKLTAAVGNGTDYYSFYDACEKDNLLKFIQSSSTAGGSYTQDEGPTKCDIDDPQISEIGTWTLNDAKTVITIVNEDSETIEVTILSLTSDTFKITYTIDDDDDPITITETYSGQ